MPDDLDDDSPEPLYLQLAAILREQIASGRIAGRLPSETDLAQRYDVSRPTAHRAVMVLVDAGEAAISRGRGVFAVPPDRRPE